MFFMSIPIQNNRKKLSGDPDYESLGNEDNQLIEILQENIDCREFILQLDENGIYRIIAKEIIPVTRYNHLEKLFREYPNQDILVKQRNWKKTVIERTRIFKP